MLLSGSPAKKAVSFPKPSWIVSKFLKYALSILSTRTAVPADDNIALLVFSNASS